jgi:hypothetical protein
MIPVANLRLARLHFHRGNRFGSIGFRRAASCCLVGAQARHLSSRRFQRRSLRRTIAANPRPRGCMEIASELAGARKDGNGPDCRSSVPKLKHAMRVAACSPHERGEMWGIPDVAAERAFARSVAHPGYACDLGSKPGRASLPPDAGEWRPCLRRRQSVMAFLRIVITLYRIVRA